ncbi:MAG: hypothetical protein CTY29_10650 [Methylobacter sp.]|nr:MAG: hypothetical protein CTY29_10650 [Methylobacter sp.]PPD21514.1 MAG: hypothetical protein CTY24_07630 [Methylobacter sp.]
MHNEPSQKASSGVDELIGRLKDEGIAAGQEKAENIVLEAQKRAEWIIAEANREAEVLLDKAKTETEAIKLAGQDALKLAGRDAYIQLRDRLTGHFKRELQRVVGQKLADKKFLEKLILALAGHVRDKTGLDQAKHLLMVLPEHVIDADALRKNTEELENGALSHFAANLAHDLLRNGIKFELSDQLNSGIFIRLTEDDMEIDFSGEAVTALLLEHLQPRFHALLEGLIK